MTVTSVFFGIKLANTGSGTGASRSAGQLYANHGSTLCQWRLAVEHDPTAGSFTDMVQTGQTRSFDVPINGHCARRYFSSW